jgi:molecular chaperone DnaK
LSKIIGIDLGTTYSCVAVMEGGQVTLIPNALGSRQTPSVVRILENGDAVVGEHALQHRFLHPASTITGIKRLIGRRYNEVMDIVRTLPYEVFIGENNLATVRVRDKSYTPQFISALILKSLKADAERYMDEKIDKAVITIPAYFNDTQRQATKEAGRIAGLDVMRIINEPTAACLAYGLDKKCAETVAVFDLGGGTFDVSILEVGDGVAEVKSIGGDGFLGGDDFDERIASWMAEEFFAGCQIDISEDAAAMQRVRAAAVVAKHEISERSEVPVKIPFLATKDGLPRDLDLALTRTAFQDICGELFERFASPCQRAMLDAYVTPKELDAVLLVGGATRMPGIAATIQSIFEKLPVQSVNPDEVVALGAAVQGGVLGGVVKDILLLDVVPISLGVEDASGAMTKIIERNTCIPTRKTEIFSTAFDNQTSVEIHVLQGENDRSDGNRSLGRLILDGIPPSPKRVPQIEVTLDIDGNGILDVTAKDKATGKEVKATIVPFTGLSRPALLELAAATPPVRPT